MEELLNKLRAFQYRLLLIIQQFGKSIDNSVNTVSILLAIFCIGNVVWQIGFDTSIETASWMVNANSLIIILFGVIRLYKFVVSIFSSHSVSIWQLIYVVAIWSFVFFSDSQTEFAWLAHRQMVDIIVVILSVYELSSLGLSFLTRKSSPTVLFVSSFLTFILVGTGLLIMPRCHYGYLSFLDALFTSTSMVCVTGLSQFDIPSTFTPFGQTIITLLIQVGGLGVMTFTCFFAMSLTGKGSLQNRIVIKELISADNMSDIFMTLKHIMYVTFIIEGLTAWALYYYFRDALVDASTHDVIFTSVFHSISSFCNAGVSNLPNGFLNPAIRHSNLLHLIIAFSIIFGALGFPLQSAAINWTKKKFYLLFLRIIGCSKRIETSNRRMRMISANNQLVFYTTAILLAFGTVFFIVSEFDTTQKGLSVFSRIVDSLFLSATSHAGFLYHDISGFSTPTLLIFIVFMWIGTSPMSTGGGIKVTTFAVAMLNLKNTLVGKENIDIFGRSVSSSSIRRAYAIMTTSILAILISTIALKVAMPGVSTVKLFFESLSALSTSGMTMDLTSTLNTAGQIIVIIDMFVGRIGVMAFILMFVTPRQSQRYKYPSENIMF